MLGPDRGRTGRFHSVRRNREIAFVPVISPLFSDVDRYPFDWVHAQIAGVLQEGGILFLELLEILPGAVTGSAAGDPLG